MPPLAILNELVPVFIFFLLYSYMRAFSSSEMQLFITKISVLKLQFTIYINDRKIKLYWIFSDSYLYIGKHMQIPGLKKKLSIKISSRAKLIIKPLSSANIFTQTLNYSSCKRRILTVKALAVLNENEIHGNIYNSSGFET